MILRLRTVVAIRALTVLPATEFQTLGLHHMGMPTRFLITPRLSNASQVLRKLIPLTQVNPNLHTHTHPM
jgi:hypothetical protein